MGHDAQSPPRQPIPVWVAQALLAVVQSPGSMPSGKGLCIFPPPGIAAGSGVGSGPTDRPDAATTRTAARRTTHNGRPQAACDLLSSAVFPPGLAHVWAFPPQSAENGARGWLQGRGRERGGGRAAAHSWQAPWPGSCRTPCWPMRPTLPRATSRGRPWRSGRRSRAGVQRRLSLRRRTTHPGC